MGATGKKHILLQNDELPRWFVQKLTIFID